VIGGVLAALAALPVLGLAVPSQADMAVTTTASPAPVSGGGEVTYHMTVTNFGPGTATHVTLEDTLPADFTLRSATPSQGTCTGTTCDLDMVRSGESATVDIVAATPCASLTRTNTARATAATNDPHPANDVASTQTSVVTPCSAVTVQAARGDVVTTNPDNGKLGTNGVWEQIGLTAGASGTVRLQASQQPTCEDIHTLIAETQAPPTDAASPHRLRLVFAAGCVPGSTPAEQMKALVPQVSENGGPFVVVPKCKTLTPLKPVPSCVGGITIFADRSAEVIIWTTGNSSWRV
jgi:uncharacterized repeat protein (TIGR01451 family)